MWRIRVAEQSLPDYSSGELLPVKLGRSKLLNIRPNIIPGFGAIHLHVRNFSAFQNW